jgi:hypothetical protein
VNNGDVGVDASAPNRNVSFRAVASSNTSMRSLSVSNNNRSPSISLSIHQTVRKVTAEGTMQQQLHRQRQIDYVYVWIHTR